MPRAIGKVATAATTEVPVNATVYTEPTSGAQRALKSGSANDAAAGTGIRKVRITYYTLASDGKITGPWSEVVTMNGVTAVATVATDIALIEKMEAVTVGSGGVAAGTIILTVDAAGAGATIASIATGEVRTFLGHHYVPTGYQCRVLDLAASGGFTTAALFNVKALRYPLPAVEQQIVGDYAASAAGGNQQHNLDTPVVAGPARIRIFTAPTADAQTGRASFGYQDDFTGGWQLTA